MLSTPLDSRNPQNKRITGTTKEVANNGFSGRTENPSEREQYVDTKPVHNHEKMQTHENSRTEILVTLC